MSLSASVIYFNNLPFLERCKHLHNEAIVYNKLITINIKYDKFNSLNHIYDQVKMGGNSYICRTEILTHCGRVTQICVFTFQPCRTGDANLRF